MSAGEALTLEPPTFTLAMHGAGGEGCLWFKDGKLQFAGDADVSAVVFIEALAQQLAGAILPSLKVMRVHPGAQIPKYQTAGAACFDLHAVVDDKLAGDVVIEPGKAHDFRIGLAFEVPPGWVMKVFSRSGHGFKHGLRLSNCTGIIDSDFRGELHVKLHNDSDVPYTVVHGDRVGQAMLEPAPQFRLIEVDALSETVRGGGGYGSTGR